MSTKEGPVIISAHATLDEVLEVYRTKSDAAVQSQVAQLLNAWRSDPAKVIEYLGYCIGNNINGITRLTLDVDELGRILAVVANGFDAQEPTGRPN